MTTHIFAAQLFVTLTASTALACWCGWGLARLALPESLRPLSALFAPLLGFCLYVLVGYWCVRTVFGLGAALPIGLAAGGALNALAWRRTGRPRPLAAARAHPLLLLLLLATLLVGVAPLIAYGRPALIGGGWDVESALPMARYLMRGPVSAIADALPNPLRDLVRDPPRIGKTIGFAIWQGSLDLLTRVESVVSFAPLLAWMRALGVLAVYLLLRAALGLADRAALLGAALTSAGALMLWTTYFNFEKQLAGWPLIPLGVLLTLVAAEELASRGRRAWPVALAAAVALAAQTIAYYPALTAWAPLTAGLGLARVTEAASGRGGRREALRLVGGALAVGLLTLAVAAPTVDDYFRGFAYRYDAQLTTLAVFDYIPPGDIVGLTPFNPDRRAPVDAPWALPGAAALLALMAAGVGLGPRRARWVGLAAGALAYLAWLRWWQSYPYAYMKGAAYIGFVFVGLAAAGWQALDERLGRLRPLAALPALGLLAALGLSQAQVVNAHLHGPGLYPRELPALLALRSLVPAGSTVTLTSHPSVEGPASGLAAYLLDHATVLGYVRTGYASSGSGTPDAIGEYGLLAAGEDPAPWGYRELLWRGGSYALYRRPPGTLAHLRLGRVLRPGETATLSVGDQRLAWGAADLPGGAARQVTLALGALAPGALAVGDATYAVPAGGAALDLPALATARPLALRNTGEEPLLVRYATLAEDRGGEPAIRPTPATLVAQATAAASGTSVTVELSALAADSGPLALALDIWDTPRGVQYGWYGVQIGARPEAQRLTLALDLATGAAGAAAPGGAAIPIGASFQGLRQGEYVARLYAAAGPVALSTPADLFSFRVDAEGRVQAVSPSGTVTLAASLERPQQPLDALVGGDARLLGYTLATPEVRAGQTISCVLWWRAERPGMDVRSVLVHLLDARGERVAQGDGPPGEGARPTNEWGASELVIDPRRVQLPPDLPPGDYTIAVGMYRWPSLERLPFTVGGQRQDGDVLHIPVRVVR